jgi:short-subunit dehydrogenase
VKIHGSHFLITGANRGIGLAVAKMAAIEGAHLYLVMRQNNQSLLDDLKKMGAQSAMIFVSDFSIRGSIEDLIEKLISIPFDIVFNNAGQLTGGLLEDQKLDDIYHMFQVNTLSLVHLTRGLLPGMIQRGRGKIINNSSVSAFMHFPCATTYAASKASVVAFTQSLGAELEGTGVTTLCLITPGIKTRMFDEITIKYGKNLRMPLDSISSENYASQIKKAILRDQTVLFPKGQTAVGLFLAMHFPSLFHKLIKIYFKR